MEGKSMRIFQVTRPNFLNCAVLGQASSQASYIAAYVDYWSVFSMVLFYQRIIVRDICQEIIAYGIIVLAPLSRRRFCLCINPHESTMTIVCRRRQLELAIVRLRARRLLWVTKIDNRAMPVHLPPSTSVSGVQII